MTKQQIEIGTTSEGSLKLDDIVAGIRNLIPKKLLKEFNTAMALDNEEEAGYIYEDIYDYLNDICPDGVYWGSTEGDGACMGFWEIEDRED